MTDTQFDALVGRLEQQARQNPAGYKRRVLLLALLGNAYVGAVVAVVVVLLVGLVVAMVVFKKFALLKLLLVVGAFLWMVLKALWVEIDAPVGNEVTAREVPELFATIEDLGRRLGAPRFHHVLITDDFNAAVVQVPRLGLLGWDRNYLLIGLPLLKSLTVEQLKAVLAHEFGHLAKGHGRVGHWLYCQRLRWHRLLAALEAQRSRASFLFKPFLRRFAPYFNAYSFPLARADEYEADAIAARLTSPRAAAEALTGVNVVGCYLAERYWPDIHQQADDQPRPAFAPFVGMGPRVASEVDEASARRWLDQALAQPTTTSDTHPALRERLQALGEPPCLALPPPGQAADRLLGEALEEITGRFDQIWQDAVLPSWQERHREVQEGRSRLAELTARHASGAELTPQEAYDRATLTETVAGDADAALDQLRALHQRAPDQAAVCLSLGARLLARDDEDGCALLEQAIELDGTAAPQCCELLRDHHARHGRPEEAAAWHRRLVEHAERNEAAAEERSDVTLRDKFEPHGLPADAVAALAAQLRAIPDLRRAYLVRKRVEHFAHRPLYVLGISVVGSFRLYPKEGGQAVVQRILETVELPGETLVLHVDGDNRPFGRKLRGPRGARIV
jgi:Zn-dependent protease with chaperone function